MHILLCHTVREGQPMLEPVHAEHIKDNRYRIQFSPGLVYGVASGDEIELFNQGKFNVVRRSGNLCIRVFSEKPVSVAFGALIEAVLTKLGGRLDGQIEHALAFTIPLQTGFASIEEIFNQFIQNNEETYWEYGNVYDESGQPLSWWVRDV